MLLSSLLRTYIIHVAYMEKWYHLSEVLVWNGTTRKRWFECMLLLKCKKAHLWWPLLFWNTQFQTALYKLGCMYCPHNEGVTFTVKYVRSATCHAGFVWGMVFCIGSRHTEVDCLANLVVRIQFCALPLWALITFSKACGNECENHLTNSTPSQQLELTFCGEYFWSQLLGCILLTLP